MRYIITTILFALLTGCRSDVRLIAKATSLGPTNSILATVWVDQTTFDLANGDEINIHFSTLNRTGSPLLRGPLRDTTELEINDTILPDSNFIFSNGPHPSGEFLPTGKSDGFCCQMTSYFNQKGVYTVSWHGDDFSTGPIVFRVLTEKMKDANNVM